MAAVISEVVTDATRLYHDSHSIMGAHAQSNGSSTTIAESQSQHSYNRLSTPQSQHHRTVPPSPRPQPTTIPQASPPRPIAAQRAPGDSGITSESATTGRSTVQRVATHGADSSRQYSQQHGGHQQRTDASIRRPDTQTTAEELRRRSTFNRSQAAENSSQTSTTSWTQSTTPSLTRAGLSLDDVRNHGGRRKNIIEVKSLDHIQSFASEEFLSQSRRGSRRTGPALDEGGGVLKYDISDMPVADIIEMVAGLLTKITTTNDRQHESLHQNMHVHSSHTSSTNTASPGERDGQGMSPMTSSVLAFHGKNVPPITILSYLSRIHKYCPTTYDVFLSLLVYFDRMTERVNAEPLAELKRRAEAAQRAASAQQNHQTRRMRDSEMEVESDEEELPQERHGDDDSEESEREEEREQDDAIQDDDDDDDIADSEPSTPISEHNRSRSERELGFDGEGGGPEGRPDFRHFFVVDGFNIHRLVIAGVTCASKFFSDVFYTNSRYAKVGGLPLNELNHLELQFLLLNDFRLSVPVEELEAYGTMLVEFYAREIIEQRKVDMGGADGDVVMMEN